MIPRMADEHTICLLAPSNYHIDICKKRYLDLIQNTLQILTKRNYIITFESKEIIPEENKYDDNLEENTKEPLNIELTKDKKNDNISIELNSNLNPKYTFNNYIIGSSNRFAHAAAIAVSENPGQKYNPLYIYGGVGLGKTHLMQAIGDKLNKTKPEMRIVYATGELFTNELITALMTNKNEEFRKKYRNVDLLLVDDVQFLAGKDKCQEEFFHTFNTLFQSGKQIVLTSEKPPKDIMLLEERLKTRFEMGLSVDIQTPDYETRLAILRKKTQNERYIINDDVLVKIASKVKSNIRELEGVFNKLVAYSSFTNSDLTDSVVDNTIESILVKNTKVLTSKLIMQVVAKFFNIKVTDLTSEKRSNSVTYPRQIAMFLCREIANLSFPAIGRDFGGRDHSTVLHAYGKMKEEFEKNVETKNVIEELKKALAIEE
jgi:chromosomal replication initiator protein